MILLNNNRKTGFCILLSLVFCFSFVACTEKNDPADVSIQWSGDRAVAIIVPQKFYSSIPEDSVKELLQIRLANSGHPIIGEYSFTNDGIIFKPIVAFTRGLKYEVYVRNQMVEEIEIQNLTTAAAPEIVAVYPALDTLPENLLKFYIVFSKPMQEGDVFKHVHLIKNSQDTLAAVFLDLELWNKEGTMLTLWLDPGRIKRDLQPNQQLGPPLSKGSDYQLVIDNDWQDKEGMLLHKTFPVNFFVNTRDSISPDEKTWVIKAPGAGTKEQLQIDFHESLDHVLAENTISLKDKNGNAVKGKFRVNDPGTIAYFSPDFKWEPGNYELQIESRLEDLAGNNLDRLFDADLAQKDKNAKGIHKRVFEIR